MYLNLGLSASWQIRFVTRNYQQLAISSSSFSSPLSTYSISSFPFFLSFFFLFFVLSFFRFHLRYGICWITSKQENGLCLYLIVLLLFYMYRYLSWSLCIFWVYFWISLYGFYILLLDNHNWSEMYLQLCVPKSEN